MTIKIAVSGACGRMAGQVLRRAHESKDLKVVAAVDAPNSPSAGKDIGEVLGMGRIGVQVVGAERIEQELKLRKPEVLVDFTTPQACVENVKIAARNGISLVVGTTGLNGKQKAEIRDAVQKARVRAIIAPNFSIAVNFFFKLAADAAAVLRDFDVELIEAHHRFKADAPSGTAKRLAELIAEARKSNLDAVAVYGRKGLVGERDRKQIGIHSVRAGDIVGDHTVLFSNLGERLEIKHQAHSRDAFAYGCLTSIKWLVDQKPGIYGMFDVLNLK
ncbi:MAG: 4-hydroxy-tetrahydrodipicolinate reductase [Candidatus Altiarchaeota archaeon]|nr:4-hydroxy-tetrahydrodipicolinate reductase [Candidatus Altiarchaeota archaeon]